MARKSVLLDPKVMSLEEHTLTEAPAQEEPEVLDVALTADSDDFSGMGSTLDRVQLQLDEVEPKLLEAETKAVALENYYDLLCKQENSGYFISKESFDLSVKTLQLSLEAVERMDAPDNDDDVLEGEYERTDDGATETKDGKPKLSSRIWATLKKIWQWLKDTSIKALDWIKDYWAKYTEGTIRLKRRLTTLEEKVKNLTGDESLELRSPNILYIDKEFAGDNPNKFKAVSDNVNAILELRFDTLDKFITKVGYHDAGSILPELVDKLSFNVSDVLLGNVTLKVALAVSEHKVDIDYDVEFKSIEIPESIVVDNVNKRMAESVIKEMVSLVDTLDAYGNKVKSFTATMNDVLKGKDPDESTPYINRSALVKVARAYLIGNQKVSQYVIKVIKAELAVLEALCDQIGKKES